MSNSEIELVAEPNAFFQELVTQALAKQRVEVQPETEFYVVNLLQRFLNTENLYIRDSSGSVREEPLALMLKDALEQPEVSSQNLLLRQLGDVSLYVAGFFQESLSRKLVDVGYYIDMGGAAYQQVATQSDEQTKQTVFSELSNRFSELVECIGEVSVATSPTQSEADVLRVYENWRSTKSEQSKRKLEKAGIVLNKKKRPQ